MAPRNRTEVCVWQWNCRGFRRKKANLLQYIKSQTTPPPIIALQETNGVVQLPGYRTHQNPADDKPNTAVLTQKHLTVTYSKFADIDIEHDFLQILPPKLNSPLLYILNVYSRPQQKSHRFDTLFARATSSAGKHTLLIVGDFNASHPAWGYTTSTPKGRALWSHIQAHRFTLYNDPEMPTRLGNSVNKDTSPDLTLTHNAPPAVWTNTQTNLGSDHYIISITLKLKHRPIAPKPLTLTN